MSQPPVSQIESGNDLYLSTLARYSSEFGGRLEIAAVFPDERVELRFRETSPATDTEPAAQ